MLAIKPHKGVWVRLFDKEKDREIGRIKLDTGKSGLKLYLDFEQDIVIHRDDAKVKRF